MEGKSVSVPVQSGFTVYVPFIVTWDMLPFTLTHALAVVPPFPSNVSTPTLAAGPAWAGGAAAAVKNPVLVYANVPVSVAFEHPFSPARAVGATPRARAVVRVTVNMFLMMVRFMIVSFAC